MSTNAACLLIRHLQHVGIPVTDLQKSKSFYGSLGFEAVMTAGFKFNDQPGECVMMKKDQITLELYRMPQQELSEIRSRGNGHIDHLAFDVSNIWEAFRTLKDEGFAVIEQEPVFLQFWKYGCLYFNITGPDGERLEFNQILDAPLP